MGKSLKKVKILMDGKNSPIKTRFTSEKELVTAYLQSIPLKKLGSFHLVHTEVDSTNGIADIVRVEMRRDWERSLCLGQIPPQWAFALRELPYRKKFTTEFFMSLTGVSKKTAIAVLKSYEDNGFCVRSEKSNFWAKVQQPLPLARSILAVEAKLFNWRRALAQAYRYLDYATESWVLLDSTNATEALKNIESFRRLNVGLLTLSPGSSPKYLFRPKPQKPKSLIRHWHVQSSIGRLGL